MSHGYVQDTHPRQKDNNPALVNNQSNILSLAYYLPHNLEACRGNFGIDIAKKMRTWDHALEILWA